MEHQIKKQCHCGKPLYAFNLCNTHYMQRRRAQQKGWDEATLDRLADFPILSWPDYPTTYQEELLDTLVELYQSKGLPTYQFESDRNPVVSVRNGKLTVDPATNYITNVGWAGQATCLYYNQHMYRSNYGSNKSAVEAWADPKLLRRAIRAQFQWGHPISPHRVLKAIRAIQKSPSNFPPVLARYLVDRYAPQDGTVFDPCMGFGGRALGVLSSTKNVTYVGQDIETATVAGNLALVNAIQAADRSLIVNKPLEGHEPWLISDMVLTCPPYFDIESYGKSSDASVATYPNYTAWVEGWLGTLLDKAVKSSKLLVVCVSPFGSGSEKQDLPADLTNLIKSKGLNIQDSFRWYTSNFGPKKRFETILVVDLSGGKV